MCISHGFTRTKRDVSKFVKLPNNCIAKGNTFLNSIAEDLDINMNENRLQSYITTALIHAGYNEENWCTAITEIIKYADRNDIGYKSQLYTKVIATTFEVLRRGKKEINLPKFAKDCNIKTNTIKKFLTELRGPTFFKVYKKYNLE